MSLIKILKENKEYVFECEGDFKCYKNKLKNLIGSPTHIAKDFDCENNELTSLDGAPKHVGGDFFCDYNPMLSGEEIEKYHRTGAVKGIMYSDHGVFK